jgi:FkbM family methyltransferase
LAAWHADAGIWSLLIKIQLRQFNWLLRDRVQSNHKREFLTLAARQLRNIPQEGFCRFVRQANDYELATLLCMQRNWHSAYDNVLRNRGRFFYLWSTVQRDGLAAVVPRARQFVRGMISQWLTSAARRLVTKVRHIEALRQAGGTLQETSRAVTGQDHGSQRGEPLVEVCRIDNHVLFLSRPYDLTLGVAKWRMESDYYLERTAIFREGDIIVDVGAYVGELSLSLAKKYPFVKVYAIEPDPACYECLRRNVELNHLASVVVINKGISGDRSKKTLYINAAQNGVATLDVQMAASYPVLRIAQVETTTLSQLFDEYGILHCRLLKINAPGAVRECLKGFTRSGAVDLLCGEAHLSDCSRVELEAASWRIARQHFWRTIAQQTQWNVRSWIHWTPSCMEPTNAGHDDHADQCDQRLAER